MEEEAGDEDASSEADPLASALAELDARWEEPAAHAKVLALGDALDRLAEVGRHYRAIDSRDEERRPLAKKQIDSLLGLAMTRVARTEKTSSTPAKSRVEWIAFGVSASLIAAALWSMLRNL